MFIRYTTVVAFFSLCAAYIASLFVGWSIAGGIPGLKTSEEHVVTLARSLAALIIAVPIWILHWRWTQRDWNWDATTSQGYLAFFTVIGLGASMFVGAQFISKVLEWLLGVPQKIDQTSFLFGAAWSTAISLFMWMYHGGKWWQYRKKAKSVKSEG